MSIAREGEVVCVREFERKKERKKEREREREREREKERESVCVCLCKRKERIGRVTKVEQKVLNYFIFFSLSKVRTKEKCISRGFFSFFSVFFISIVSLDDILQNWDPQIELYKYYEIIFKSIFFSNT